MQNNELNNKGGGGLARSGKSKMMPPMLKDRIVCPPRILPRTLDIPSPEALQWRAAVPSLQPRALRTGAP
jgi:hypothetical protein